MKKVNLTYGQAIDLLVILTSISKMPRIPIKFCIIRNINVLRPIVDDVNSRCNELFMSKVILDDMGRPTLNLDKGNVEFDSSEFGVPIENFLFESEDDKVEVLTKISEIKNEKIDVEFHEESVSRVIRISDSEGKYSSTSIKDVLEDPESPITAEMLLLLLEYFLKE